MSKTTLTCTSTWNDGTPCGKPAEGMMSWDNPRLDKSEWPCCKDHYERSVREYGDVKWRPLKEGE